MRLIDVYDDLPPRDRPVVTKRLRLKSCYFDSLANDGLFIWRHESLGSVN